jgi:hypothetical protein
MEASWGMAEALLAYPQLADLLVGQPYFVT